MACLVPGGLHPEVGVGVSLRHDKGHEVQPPEDEGHVRHPHLRQQRHDDLGVAGICLHTVHVVGRLD